MDEFEIRGVLIICSIKSEIWDVHSEENLDYKVNSNDENKYTNNTATEK